MIERHEPRAGEIMGTLEHRHVCGRIPEIDLMGVFREVEYVCVDGVRVRTAVKPTVASVTAIAASAEHDECTENCGLDE